MIRGNVLISGLIDRLRERTKVNPVSGCWEWQGSTTHSGHGEIYWRGKLRKVHRLAAYISLGLDLEDRRQANHKCDNPACWWWAHLYIGTQRDNLSDMTSRNRGRHWGMKC